jgi:hypothetical protein
MFCFTMLAEYLFNMLNFFVILVEIMNSKFLVLIILIERVFEELMLKKKLNNY